ncbi:SDR family NAD(P)-dependent oxidoreductase [Lacrimispora sp. 38-1]|uniref:SDR family NAD(P)-dependent oxidoreductase n=1 Tax=Lacrimispora sp. 38-1 TaxID=3125778 RepID=UPI003CF16D62
MIDKKYKRSEILKLIEEKKLTAKEGMKLLREAHLRAGGTDTKVWVSRWKEHARSSDPRQSGGRKIVLFGKNEDIREKLVTKLNCQTADITLVIAANGFEKCEENIFHIAPSNKEDYDTLFQNLIEQDRVPDEIVHVWSFDNFSEDVKTVKEQIEQSFYSMLFIAQSILQLKIKKEMIFRYFFADPSGNNPVYAAVSGAAKTMHSENNNWKCSVIGIEQPAAHTDDAEIADILSAEINSDCHNDEIRYRNGIRFIKEYAKTQKPDSNLSPVIKKNGNYLITGGAGGLGSHLAEYLAEKYNARLILTGRRDLDSTIEALVEKLKRKGSDSFYFKSDLTNAGQVEELIRSVHSKYGKIDGIFHCAGIVHDAMMLNKTPNMIEEVIGPKIYGSIYLHKMLEKESPDFFAFFSALASVLGNVGQIDYAYGNAFLDNFVDYVTGRESNTKFLSIDWPFWENGGMQIEADKIDWLRDTYGMLPLKTEEGMELLDNVIRSPMYHVIAANVMKEKEELFIKKLTDPEPAEKAADSDRNVRPAESMAAAIESYLRIVIAEELKLKPDSILLSEPWEKYGMNSVSIVKITNQMEKKFGTLSKTLFFEYQTLKELVDYFVENHSDFVNSKLMSKADNAGERGTVLPKYEKSAEDYERHGDIAVIGISGRYPMAHNLREYWENLKNGKDCISEIPAERWDYHKFYSENKQEKGKSYSKWGGFLDDYDKFDPLFFGITPRDAELMDPQERLFLEETWHAMEDAGYSMSKLKNYEVGVYAGAMYGHYQIFGAEETLQGTPLALSSSYSSIANRVSYLLDLRGPSIAIDTMCSSSLTTVHLACESIKNGECQMAFAGGVNLTIHPTKYMYLCANNFASSDGRCRSFGDGGDGYVPSEGVGVVLLKSMEQAERDGDHIYAVIRGTAINHGGRANGYTVPNPNSQTELIRKALKKAAVNPKEISYVEAHGTGTSLGDPIEIAGLTKAYRPYTTDTQYCSIGSVKSNIGHAESAAGIAALTKVILQMRYKTLVPSIHNDILNTNIDFKNSPFFVQKNLTDWNPPILNVDGTARQGKRIAAVSAFGAGGSNAHLIIEEYAGQKGEKDILNHEPQIIVLSARNKEQLRKYVRLYLDFIKEIDPVSGISFNEFAYTLQTGRESKDCRIGLAARNISDVYKAFEAFYEDMEGCTGVFKSWKISGENLPEPEEAIPKLAERNEYEPLVKIWVSGKDIDWNILYPDGHPKRMSLPSYPFEEKRYWYNSYQNESRVSDNGNAIHEYDGDEVTLQIIDDSVALVTMHDEKNKNMFSEKLVLGLMAKFEEIRNNLNVKAVVVTGYDHIFSMGGTQEQLLEIADRKRSFTDVPFLYRGLLEFPLPVISAIQGHASGGGLLFGLFGDVVIMSEEGIYSAVFTKYGFTPGMGATYILKERFGVNLSTEMMFTAKSYSGRELREKGAGVTVVKAGEVLAEAVKIARLIADKPLITLQTLKKESAGKKLKELPAYIERESVMHEKTFGKPEVKERINKYFLNTRSFHEVSAKESIQGHFAGTPPEMDLSAMLEALEKGNITPEEAANIKNLSKEV